MGPSSSTRSNLISFFSRDDNPVDLTVRGRPVLPRITERLEFVDAPGHAADLERYRARGYRMVNNRIHIVTDHDADLVEVHPPSRGTVDMGGLTVERCSPVLVRG